MIKYTDDDLRNLLARAIGNSAIESIATELLAARRELAELRSAYVVAEKGHCAAVVAQSRAEQERDALRAKLAAADVDPREIQRGDEYLYCPPGTCIEQATMCGLETPALTPTCRFIRIPVPAAAPESAPAPLAFGAAVSRVQAERMAQAFDKFNASLGIPEHVINAPPQHVTATQMGLAQPESAPAEKAGKWTVGERVYVFEYDSSGTIEAIDDTPGILCRYGVRLDRPSPRDGRHWFRTRDLAPAPPPEPVEKPRFPGAIYNVLITTDGTTEVTAKRDPWPRVSDVPQDGKPRRYRRTIRDGSVTEDAVEEINHDVEALVAEARLDAAEHHNRQTAHLERKIQAQRAEIHRLRARVKPPKPEPVTFTAQGMALDEERAKSRPTEADFMASVRSALDKAPLYPMTEDGLRANPGDPVRNAEAWAAFLGIRFGEKQPEPPAEGADVNQLRFIAALGADGDVPVHSLSSMMSLNRARTHRCMAVEIARRRLAEMDAETKPAEGAGETLRQAVNKRHGWPVERHISDARVPWYETGADIGRFRTALRRVAYESDDFDSRVIALDALLGYGDGR